MRSRWAFSCTCSIVLLFIARPVWAQATVALGFKSVGRGAPLIASLPTFGFSPDTSPSGFRRPALRDWPFVGPAILTLDVPGLNGLVPEQVVFGSAWEGAAPKEITPLAVDLFTSKDFYQDAALWSDKRYYRCNSPQAVESQQGGNVPVLGKTIGRDPPRTAAWGYCDRGYPREAIISPYPFTTAQAHYDALLTETRSRGGPTVHSYATVPGELTGQYQPGGPGENWYAMMFGVQSSTVASLLTPEYRKRFVQELYHQGNTNAPQWPSQYCWAEGFMRRWYPPATGVQPHYVMVTPKAVQISAGTARNLVTNIYIGRSFEMDGAVPRLGADVPRWYGETIGFWDGDTLITWTSNVQGWTAHSAFEFSSKMQTVEIYTPARDASGHITGFNHEAVFYDPEALLEPIRIVRNFVKTGDLDAGSPYTYIECVQTIFPVNGKATPLSPGSSFQYDVLDIFNRPWAQILEKYHEQGMKKPQATEDLFNFNR
jgi:hypothetical protein